MEYIRVLRLRNESRQVRFPFLHPLSLCLSLSLSLDRVVHVPRIVRMRYMTRRGWRDFPREKGIRREALCTVEIPETKLRELVRGGFSSLISLVLAAFSFLAVLPEMPEWRSDVVEVFLLLTTSRNGKAFGDGDG